MRAQLLTQHIGRAAGGAGNRDESIGPCVLRGQHSDQGPLAVAEHGDGAEAVVVPKLADPRRGVFHIGIEAQLTLGGGCGSTRGNPALVVTHGRDSLHGKRLGKQLQAVVGTRNDRGVAVAIRWTRASMQEHQRVRTGADRKEQRAVDRSCRGFQAYGVLCRARCW